MNCTSFGFWFELGRVGAGLAIFGVVCAIGALVLLGLWIWSRQ